MPRYRVELETETLKGQPDESFAATVDAEDSAIAIALVKVMALRNGCRGRVYQSLCQRVDEHEPEATPEPLDEEADADYRPLDTLPEDQRALAAKWVASLRYPRDGKRWTDSTPAPLPEPTLAEIPEAWAFTRFSDEQAATITAMAKTLAPGCGVRLALELALATDRAQKMPTAKAHDFGRFGSADYCRRKDCQAKNQPPVNRWGCKGAA